MIAGQMGCATVDRVPAPISRIEDAKVVGIGSHTRAFGLGGSENLQADFVDALVEGGSEQACDFDNGQPVMCVLVLSGGGGSGSFGAGLLNGWTERGDRPEFKIVTGVSTGALIASFAFLGASYDDELAEAFTTIESMADVIAVRSIFSILRGDAIADSTPLARLIEHYIDEAMVAAIAKEHHSGRRLYVGTTNLDAQRLTIWNIGAIAFDGGPRALQMIRKIILASSTVPVVMPPVVFDVTIDGKPFQELHADGGVQAQFFIPLDVVDLSAAIREAQRKGFRGKPKPKLYVIRNAKFQPKPESIDRDLGSIARRTFYSMTQAMGRSDLYKIFAISRARESELEYAEVPADFIWRSDDEFDGDEMRRLFDVGLDLGRSGEAWQRDLIGLFSRNAGFTPDNPTDPVLCERSELSC